MKFGEYAKMINERVINVKYKGGSAGRNQDYLDAVMKLAEEIGKNLSINGEYVVKKVGKDFWIDILVKSSKKVNDVQIATNGVGKNVFITIHDNNDEPLEDSEEDWDALLIAKEIGDMIKRNK